MTLITPNLFDRLLLQVAAVRGYVLGTAGVNPNDLFNGGSGDTPAEYGEYITTSNAVYSIANKRAKLLAGLPIKLYKGQGKNRKEVERGKLRDLLNKVNPYWTRNRLIYMVEMSLCLWGKAPLFLERGQTGKMPPREMWWGRGDRMKVFPDPVDYIKGYTYAPANGGQPIFYQPSEVINLRYPHPLNEWDGLSPLAAARLAADYMMAANKTNKALFDNGITAGGIITPKQNTRLTKDQAEELAILIDRRMRGVDKAHRWSVFRFDAEFKPHGFSPKDAEYIAGMQLALEEVARAYDYPLDLIGGQRTYENVQAAMRALWEHCLIPECEFISTEFNETLLPMFNEADECEFDTSKISALQPDKNADWLRVSDQIKTNAITVNQWRADEGLDPLEWGDKPYAQIIAEASLQMTSGDVPSDDVTEDEGRQTIAASSAVLRLSSAKRIYGDAEHRAAWDKFVTRAVPNEKKFSRELKALLEAQRQSVLASLKAERSSIVLRPSSRAFSPFDMKEWIKKFRAKMRTVIRDVTADAGNAALNDLSITLAFDVERPQVNKFIEQRTQRFAKEVNETTWNKLQNSLSAGIEAGEGFDALEERVNAVMGTRIQSDSETITRTEVIGAMNGGTVEAWKQSGVVTRKKWLAEIDDRTRDSHREAHGDEVGLDEDFEVGEGAGPAPGQLGVASEDINCRCTITPVVE